VEGGALAVETNGQVHRAQRGDLVLLDPGTPHAMRHEQDTPVTAIVLEVCEDRMRRCLDLDEGEDTPRFSAPVVRDEPAADALRELHRALAHERAAERQGALGQLEPLICHLMAEHASSASDGLDAVRAEAIDSVRDYLDEHLGERLALDELAESIGASKFQLVRCFKRRVGVPPLGYQLQRRINRAKVLLAEGMSIAEVAIELGFADQSHLTRHFRRLTLMTPGDYQRGRRPSA
jgi:AraC-like DNA-binding protein